MSFTLEQAVKQLEELKITNARLVRENAETKKRLDISEERVSTAMTMTSGVADCLRNLQTEHKSLRAETAEKEKKYEKLEKKHEKLEKKFHHLKKKNRAALAFMKSEGIKYFEILKQKKEAKAKSQSRRNSTASAVTDDSDVEDARDVSGTE